MTVSWNLLRNIAMTKCEWLWREQYCVHLKKSSLHFDIYLCRHDFNVCLTDGWQWTNDKKKLTKVRRKNRIFFIALHFLFFTPSSFLFGCGFMSATCDTLPASFHVMKIILFDSHAFHHRSSYFFSFSFHIYQLFSKEY